MQLSPKELGFLGPAFDSHMHEVDVGASVTDERKRAACIKPSLKHGVSNAAFKT